MLILSTGLKICRKAQVREDNKKKPKEGFEKKSFEIKGNHDLNTRKRFVFGRAIICTYSLNEEKGLQE